MSRITVLRMLRRAAVATLVVTASLIPVQASAAVPDQYVALGDSYSSGNGTYQPDLDVGCYRSSAAYPFLTSQQRPNTALTFVACQGATTDDVVNSQVSALNAGTNLGSITIGGNDVGFINLLIACAGPDTTCKAQVDDTNNKIKNELPAKLDRAYAAIKAHAPNARTVAVLDYPHPFGADLSCPAAQGVSADEAGWINGVVDNLDATIANRAAAAGFSYKTSIQQFTGHDVCAPIPFLNGATPSVADMYHPTRIGHSNGYTPLLRQVIG